MPRLISPSTRQIACPSWLLALMSAALVALLVPWALPAISARATARSAPRVRFDIPWSNVAFSAPVLDDRHVVYGVAVPRFHPPVCVSCGQQPFTNFHVQIYVRDYQRRSTSITVSQPHRLFRGPPGAQIALFSLSGNWLVYETDTLQDRWQFFARNVVTGRIILLDSPQMEGQPSRFLHASSDGRTVVWQSWTRIHGQTMSVIRSYALDTGRRQLLLSGGSGTDYLYPQIAGNHLIFARSPGTNPGSQLFVENLATRHVRALTPPGQSNFEPFISGNIVVWVHGSLTVGHSHGLVVADLATDRRVALKRSSTQLPQIAAGRYVVFAADYPRASVQIYDALTRQRRTIAAGQAPGFVPGQPVAAGGDAALFQMGKPCGVSNGVCPTYFTLISLGY